MNDPIVDRDSLQRALVAYGNACALIARFHFERRGETDLDRERAERQRLEGEVLDAFDALRLGRARHRDLLITYFEHAVDCPQHYGARSRESGLPCDCGRDAALAAILSPVGVG